MKNYTRFARITNFGKLADRFLTCQINQPTSPELSSKGSLYLLIEIKNPWISSAQIGQTIVNTLLRFYYRADDNSNLVNFENTLKKVNEALAQMTQNGETDWIGNLNSLIILNVGNELHISQTGSTTAFLIRNSSISDLTFENETGEIHPLKTFSNIASGTLEPGDKVFISNTQINHFISREKLEKIINDNSPKYGLFEITKILKKQHNKSVNAIVLEALDEESNNNALLEDLPETIYLDQPLESYLVTAKKYYSSYITPNIKKTGHLLKKIGIKTLDFTQKTILPSIKKFSKKTSKKISEVSNQTGTKISPKISSFSEKIKNKTGFAEKSHTIGRYKVSHYNEAKYVKFIKNLFNWFKEHPKYFYGVTAVILILIAICLISNRSQNNTNQNGNQLSPTVTKVEELITNANKLIIFNEKDKAMQTLAEAKSIILSDETLSEESKKELNLKVNNLLNKEISAQEVIFNNQLNFIGANKIFVYNNKVYGFNNSDSTLVELNLKNEPTSKPILSGSQSQSKLFYFDGNENLYIENGLNELYIYNLKKNGANKLNTSAGWVQGTNLFKYGKNLYFLDGLNNAIVKYVEKEENSYGDAFEYITDKTALEKPVSFDIDGKIYVLQASGEVIQFSLGKKTDFKLSDIPAPYSQIYSPLKITVSENSNELYIVDLGDKENIGARIILFDKNGKFAKQYLLPENMKNIQDVIIQPQTKKLWVLSDSKIHESTLPE